MLFTILEKLISNATDIIANTTKQQATTSLYHLNTRLQYIEDYKNANEGATKDADEDNTPSIQADEPTTTTTTTTTTAHTSRTAPQSHTNHDKRNTNETSTAPAITDNKTRK